MSRTEKRHSGKDKNAVNQTLKCNASVIALFRLSTWWMSFALLTIITIRKRSPGKVMFLHVFVILSTGGWYNVTSRLIPYSFQRGMVPGGKGDMVPGVGSQEGEGGMVPGGYGPRGRVQYILTPLLLTSSGNHRIGRYASYWNAFLFITVAILAFRKLSQLVHRSCYAQYVKL